MTTTLPPKELAEIKEIRKVSQKLDAMYLDEKEKGYYDTQQKFWLDQNAFIKETVEKAVEQAELNKQIEIAKNAILENFDSKIIAKLTGLTVEQIQQLRNEEK